MALLAERAGVAPNRAIVARRLWGGLLWGGAHKPSEEVGPIRIGFNVGNFLVIGGVAVLSLVVFLAFLRLWGNTGAIGSGLAKDATATIHYAAGAA